MCTVICLLFVTIFCSVQHDVIGQNFIDIVEEDDASTITDNLESKTTPPATHLDGRTEFQHRQFYVRIKSSVSPGKMQLSRFTSHVVRVDFLYLLVYM